MAEAVLLTGGAGYIGSHTCLALARAGYRPIVVDDFSNSDPSVIGRLGRIAGQPVACERLDILDPAGLAGVFARHPVRAVIHFAALKSVPDSIARPLDYYRVNVGGLVGLMQAMQAAGVFTLVFSSSATVYGAPAALPIPETAPRGFTSPYGHTKLVSEQLLEQARAADGRWKTGVLRYFNPVGADASGLIGEEPRQAPTNLMPVIARVAAGALPGLTVFGDDWDTPDGTAVRDYIHVSDLAEGHVLSLGALLGGDPGHVLNLGTGRGHSVREVIAAYGRAAGRALPFRVAPRRPGDVAALCADPRRAEALLGFRARRDLDEMCASSWHRVQRAAAGEAGRESPE